MSPEDLSSAIESIYDAALEPARWPDALTRSAAFVGAQAAGLLAKSAIDRVGSIHHQVGVEQQFIALYENEFWQFDPLAPLQLFAVGEIVVTADYIADTEFREGRFYREWAAPQGWIDAANMVVEKSALMFSLLSFIRSAAAGMVDDEMRRRIRLIFPHVRRAVLIGDALKTTDLAADRLAAAMDRLNAGLFLLDREGNVVHANAPGHAMIADNVLPGRELASPGAAPAARELEGRDGRHYVAHLLPLDTGRRRRIGESAGATSALFVEPATFAKPSVPELIGERYGLTPAELRVLLAMADADGTAAVARRLGVSEATVSTHLARLFDKTGTTRQVELVKLLAAYADHLLR